MAALELDAQQELMQTAQTRMRKCSVAGNGSKAAKQRAEFCPFLTAAVHCRRSALWLLARLLPGSVGPYPPGRLVGGKVDGSLNLTNRWLSSHILLCPTACQPQLAHTRWSVVWGKADASLHQKIITHKKMGEAQSFSFSHSASIPVGLINYAFGYFWELAETKVKSPPGGWAK